jgi:hypothetical protein
MTRMSKLRDAQSKAELREIAAPYLGKIVFRAAKVVLFGIKTENSAGAGTPGSTGSLRGGRTADTTELECRQTCPRRVGSNPGETAVDNRRDAFNGHRTLGHIGGKDKLSFGGWREGPILLCWREVAMECEYEDAGLAR